MHLYLLVALFNTLLFHRSCVHGLLPAKQTSGIRRRRHRVVVAPLKLNNIFNTELLDGLFPKNERQTQWPKVDVPPGFTVPEPRPLTITESTDLGGFVAASAGLALRLATGAFVLGLLDQATQPTETIVLFDNESSPRCKRVREMMNLLDITYECRPCFGTDTESLPCIDDPNIGGKISGDNDIIEHLLENYGPPQSTFDRKALWPITFQEFSLVTSQLTALIRGNSGSTQQPNARPDNASMKPLELWAYECSPFVRPVKEKLSSLGLPHKTVSCSRGSRNRDRMVKKTGRFQVPYLVDANTGIEMFEGPEIVEYLDAVYTVKE
ncbi:hypothetical protein ACHAXR_004979 [Thalassiosira sp. AJA248-18]